MYKKLNIYVLGLFLVLTISINAQQANSCVNEILKLEEETFGKDYTNSEKTIYMNYSIQSTGWDGKMVLSNVKIYRYRNRMNFFSEQANIYQDDKNSILVLKPQQVVVVNQTPKNIPSNYSDEFVKARIAFLKSCDVIKCESAEKNVKTLELKSKTKLGGELKIDRMIYTYNSVTGKLLNCETYYDKGFQVKKIVIEFKTLDFNSDYKFSKTAKKYVMNNEENLIASYRGFELVDNTK